MVSGFFQLHLLFFSLSAINYTTMYLCCYWFVYFLCTYMNLILNLLLNSTEQWLSFAVNNNFVNGNWPKCSWLKVNWMMVCSILNKLWALFSICLFYFCHKINNPPPSKYQLNQNAKVEEIKLIYRKQIKITYWVHSK